MSGNDGESDGVRNRAEAAVGTRRRDADLFDLRSAAIAAVGTGAYYLLAVSFARTSTGTWGFSSPSSRSTRSSNVRPLRTNTAGRPVTR